MNIKGKISILILAAGGSSRMGAHIKQILPWKDYNLLGNAVETAQATLVDNTFIVLGAFDDIIKAEVNFEPNSIIFNPNWKNGLGSSIATGITHFLSKKLSFDAVLIMLADQPFIDTTYLNEMLENWNQNPTKILTTQYKNRVGVPAIFGEKYFLELQKLNKDFGAKEIIAANASTILAMNPEGKEIDIDSWETYQYLLKKIK